MKLITKLGIPILGAARGRLRDEWHEELITKLRIPDSGVARGPLRNERKFGTTLKIGTWQYKILMRLSDTFTDLSAASFRHGTLHPRRCSSLRFSPPMPLAQQEMWADSVSGAMSRRT